MKTLFGDEVPTHLWLLKGRRSSSESKIATNTRGLGTTILSCSQTGVWAIERWDINKFEVVIGW